jgi:hypothetical protein
MPASEHIDQQFCSLSVHSVKLSPLTYYFNTLEPTHTRTVVKVLLMTHRQVPSINRFLDEKLQSWAASAMSNYSPKTPTRIEIDEQL